MTQTPRILPIPWGFFLSRLLILTGMVLVFTSVGAIIGSWLARVLYNVDLTSAGMFDIVSRSKEEPELVPALKLFQVFAGSIGMFLLPALLFPRAVKERVGEYLRLNNPTPYYSWIVAVLMVLLALPLVAYLYQLNKNINLPASWAEFESRIKMLEEQANELTSLFIEAKTLPMLFLNLLIVAVLPAICEEFFFRGIVQNFIRQCFHNEWIAIIFAAIIFSGFHGQFYGFLPRVFLGILLGYLYVVSGNLWVTVLAHFFNNALAVIMIYLSHDYPGVAFFDESYVFPLSITLLSAVLLFSMLWFYQKTYRTMVLNTIVNKRTDKDDDDKEKGNRNENETQG